MPSISIHLSQSLVEATSSPQGSTVLATAARQAVDTVLKHGPRITYAPVLVKGVGVCAMSARGGRLGVVIEIDGPGTALPGRGVVVDRDRKPAARR